mgnify:FL=1
MEQRKRPFMLTGRKTVQVQLNPLVTDSGIGDFDDKLV